MEAIREGASLPKYWVRHGGKAGSLEESHTRVVGIPFVSPLSKPGSPLLQAPEGWDQP